MVKSYFACKKLEPSVIVNIMQADVCVQVAWYLILFLGPPVFTLMSATSNTAWVACVSTPAAQLG